MCKAQLGGVDVPVDALQQRALLAGFATGEIRLGVTDPPGVETDDVEAFHDFIGECSVSGGCGHLQTAPARPAGIHEQIAEPLVRRRGPVHVDRDAEAAGLRVPVVRRN